MVYTFSDEYELWKQIWHESNSYKIFSKELKIHFAKIVVKPSIRAMLFVLEDKRGLRLTRKLVLVLHFQMNILYQFHGHRHFYYSMYYFANIPPSFGYVNLQSTFSISIRSQPRLDYNKVTVFKNVVNIHACSKVVL